MPVRRATSLDDLPDRSDLLSRSGLEFMQDMIAGRLAGPPIGATLGFWPVVAEDGQVVFEGATGELRGLSGDRLYATGSTTCIIMRPEPG